MDLSARLDEFQKLLKTQRSRTELSRKNCESDRKSRASELLAVGNQSHRGTPVKQNFSLKSYSFDGNKTGQHRAKDSGTISRGLPKKPVISSQGHNRICKLIPKGRNHLVKRANLLKGATVLSSFLDIKMCENLKAALSEIEEFNRKPVHRIREFTRLLQKDSIEIGESKLIKQLGSARPIPRVVATPGNTPRISNSIFEGLFYTPSGECKGLIMIVNKVFQRKRAEYYRFFFSVHSGNKVAFIYLEKVVKSLAISVGGRLKENAFVQLRDCNWPYASTKCIKLLVKNLGKQADLAKKSWLDKLKNTYKTELFKENEEVSKNLTMYKSVLRIISSKTKLFFTQYRTQKTYQWIYVTQHTQNVLKGAKRLKRSIYLKQNKFFRKWSKCVGTKRNRRHRYTRLLKYTIRFVSFKKTLYFEQFWCKCLLHLQDKKRAVTSLNTLFYKKLKERFDQVN